MDLRDFLPFRQAPAPRTQKRAIPIVDDEGKPLAKSMRYKTLALGSMVGLSRTMTNHGNFESPPYDFTRIQQAVDTDSYAKQAFAKHRELFWKEGWDLVGENTEAVNYLWERIDYLEIAMNQPFNTFLKEVVDNLIKFHNVFIVKVRDDKSVLRREFPAELGSLDSRGPVIGYYIIPTETVKIERDKHNRPIRYKQDTDDTMDVFTHNKDTSPMWPANDVIHLALDKRSGYAFGTPFMTATIDDLLSLRQIEEDLLNLIHRELFPLLTFQIGTDEHPADQDEIDQAQAEVEGLRTEGALVMPHRHNVAMLGTDGDLIDASPYLNHFKERAAIGLGVFPHHLGITGSGANRAMTDRLDVMLYDKVKEKQTDFGDQIRFHIFNEILREGGFDPTVNPKTNGISDRVIMQFVDIDQDTKIKKESHVITKVAAGLETIPEGRLEMRMPPEIDEEATAEAQSIRLQPVVNPAAGSPAPKSKSSTNGTPESKKRGKGASNIVRPTNQYGTKTSPNIRRSDDSAWLKEVVELLDVEYDIIEDTEQ